MAEEATRLKQAPGQPILVDGSAQLLHTLREHDPVDEYRLMVHPAVLGGGKRLFRDGLGATLLKLIDPKTFSIGIIVLTYAPARRNLHDPSIPDASKRNGMSPAVLPVTSRFMDRK